MVDKEHKPARPDGPTIFFIVTAVVAAVAVLVVHGVDRLEQALGHALLVIVTVLPLTTMGVLLASYVRRLVPPDAAQRWFRAGSGWRNMSTMALAGSLTPGGPHASFPLARTLLNMGAAFPVCVAYVTAWSVLGLQRLMVWEIPMLGAKFALTRFLISIPLPLLAGLLAVALVRLGRRRP